MFLLKLNDTWYLKAIKYDEKKYANGKTFQNEKRQFFFASFFWFKESNLKLPSTIPA